MDLPLDSISQLCAAQQRGEVTARQIVDEVLVRIEKSQPSIGAYLHVAHDVARHQADSVDQKRRAGKPLGPLAGIPVALKDVLCTQDMPTTCASRMLEGYIAPYDATIVKRLRAADAVIVGKVNMDEFAMGGSTENSAYQKTANPWDISRTPGGSSGGSAAAVACGTVPLALGSDTGGSIRQPAAFCGISGLKPTYGRVSRYGLVAFASSLDQIGPLGYEVNDLAVALNAIAGHDSRDATSLDRPVEDWTAACSTSIAGWRIGLIREQLDSDGLDPDVRASVIAAARELEAAGGRLVDVHLPNARHWVPTYYVVAPCEASSNLARYDGAHLGRRVDRAVDDPGRCAGEGGSRSSHGRLTDMYCDSRRAGFGVEVRRRILLGTYALSAGYYDAYYLKSLQVRRLIADDFAAAFTQADILLGPTTPSPAFRLGEKIDDPLAMYLADLFTVGANLAGIPALSIPGPAAGNGLPIGVQLQARPLAEDKLFAVGATLQRQTDWHRRRPPALASAGTAPHVRGV
jgi:aspartyl-tRNA(Asn)/glutamyl-tRNA(Gln) amidotransferase subunit A